MAAHRRPILGGPCQCGGRPAGPCRLGADDVAHGSRYGYKLGCACDACRDAQADGSAAWAAANLDRKRAMTAASMRRASARRRAEREAAELAAKLAA
jgi:hypothetical protein